MNLIRLLVAVFLLAASFGASARDMTNRLGVGYRNSLVTMSLPSIAAFYYPSSDLGLVGSLGIDTEETNSKFALSGSVRRIIFKEEHLNFFGAGQVAIVNNEVAGSKDSGFELAATVGAEFFLQGLESLGFQFETGAGITNVKKTRFRTLGDSFVNAGLAFYF
jgi:hypothetical protein